MGPMSLTQSLLPKILMNFYAGKTPINDTRRNHNEASSLYRFPRLLTKDYNPLNPAQVIHPDIELNIQTEVSSCFSLQVTTDISAKSHRYSISVCSWLSFTYM